MAGDSLRPVYLGDDLYACQPMLDTGDDFLLTCKQDSHKTLYEYLVGVDLSTHTTTSGRGAQRRTHHYRWMIELPIRDGDGALHVNWLEITIRRPDNTVTQRAAFITSLDVNLDNVAELAACARTRWKIENETVNVLKQHGYHLEHNFGHGKDTLASVLVVLNLLAFALHAPNLTQKRPAALAHQPASGTRTQPPATATDLTTGIVIGKHRKSK